MPLFYFILKDGCSTIPDRDGVELSDEHAARSEAICVARELMRNRQHQTRLWRLQVCDAYLRPCFELLFASIDDSRAHLPVESRAYFELVCHNTAALQDAILDLKGTLAQLRDTLTKADEVMANVHAR